MSLLTGFQQGYSELMQARRQACLKFRYLRDIGSGDYRPGWRKRLIEVGATQELAESVTKVLPNGVRTGDVLGFDWSPSGVMTVRLNTNVLGEVRSVGAYQAVLDTVLGPDAPKGVPENLLGERPKNRVKPLKD